MAPVELDRLTVEEEVAMMQRGKSGRLVIAALVLVAVGTGAASWMKRMDTRDAYATAAASVTRLSHQRVDAFFACALPRAEAAQLQSKDGLMAAFDNHGTLLGRAHAGVLARCTPALAELSTELAAVRVPNPLRAQLNAVGAAADALKHAADLYRAQLNDSAGYDDVRMLPAIEKVVLAREAFLERKAALERAVHAATD